MLFVCISRIALFCFRLFFVGACIFNFQVELEFKVQDISVIIQGLYSYQSIKSFVSPH